MKIIHLIILFLATLIINYFLFLGQHSLITLPLCILIFLCLLVFRFPFIFSQLLIGFILEYGLIEAYIYFMDSSYSASFIAFIIGSGGAYLTIMSLYEIIYQRKVNKTLQNAGFVIWLAGLILIAYCLYETLDLFHLIYHLLWRDF